MSASLPVGFARRAFVTLSRCHDRVGAQGPVRLVAGALLLACSIAAGWSPSVIAAEPLVAFEDDTQRARYERLLTEYRCLKCQNQDLAGSNAALAGDLRREIRTRVIQGADDETIDNYLVDRYGDFVRYRPRFSGVNLVLWIGPFVLLVVGLGAGFLMARRSQRALSAPDAGGAHDDDAAVDEARRLLERQTPERPETRKARSSG